jgi:hypothetical protein
MHKTIEYGEMEVLQMPEGEERIMETILEEAWKPVAYRRRGSLCLLADDREQ